MQGQKTNHKIVTVKPATTANMQTVNMQTVKRDYLAMHII